MVMTVVMCHVLVDKRCPTYRIKADVNMWAKGSHPG